jgi:GNAT superfamily N-acetyltransferase
MAEYKIIAYNAPALPDSYKSMIYSKWLRSLRYGNDYYKLIDQKAYYASYHAHLERLLSRQDTIIRMAVLSDDYDVVLGFAVCRPDVVDYIHVHKDYRRKGIGTSLIPSLELVSNVTHLTRNGIALWTAVAPMIKFNPFI